MRCVWVCCCCRVQGPVVLPAAAGAARPSDARAAGGAAGTGAWAVACIPTHTSTQPYHIGMLSCLALAGRPPVARFTVRWRALCVRQVHAPCAAHHVHAFGLSRAPVQQFSSWWLGIYHELNHEPLFPLSAAVPNLQGGRASIPFLLQVPYPQLRRSPSTLLRACSDLQFAHVDLPCRFFAHLH